MAKMTKCTFRKEPRPTGLGAIASPNPDTKIKLNGEWVGTISGPSRFGHDQWRVGVMAAKLPTEEEPASFKWVFFKASFDSEPEARAWFVANEASIRERFPLRERD